MTPAELLERVLAAKGPDREIDKWLFVVTAESPFDVIQGTVTAVLGGFRAVLEDKDIPAFTASLDAALALVERVRPEATVRFIIHRASDFSGPFTEARLPDTQDGTYAPTPALALIAALIRSMTP